MQEVELTNLVKEIETTLLFEIEHLVVNQGERIGIVGGNGKGKSTLLKMIVGEDSDYEGRIEVQRSWSYVPQLKESSKMSGGEQSIASIQQAFEANRPLLLLDEPTSNLDRDHLEDLIQALKDSQQTLLVVSHDRYFLDQLVDKIWEIDQQQVTEYVGNYSQYLEQKAQERHRQQINYEAYQKKVNQLEEEAKKRMERASRFKKRKKNVSVSDYKVMSRMGKYDAQEKSLAKSSKALSKRIEQLEEVEAPNQAPHYFFKEVGHLSNKKQTLLNLRANDVSVAGRFLFHLESFKLLQGEKVSINGPNQAGKTSFFRQLLAQELAGYYTADLNIGYFAQNFDELEDSLSLLANVQATSLQEDYLIRNVLAALGFDIHRVDQKVATLSGGERVRLQFAKVLLGNHNLLLLDEPTNYLDITTLEAVEGFLKDYPGAFILVSHDREFVEATAEQHYFIEEQKLITRVYQANYEDSAAKQLQLLTFRLEQLVADPEASLEEIRALKQEIEALGGR
ncbi:ribosomal protection-like ABC-F family protein [Facklamia lactis]|uniref:ribosomal protection-like ABC-F family protein n=1 Tax=Facklamia lactis TaxID=2749967 RepID=UPI0018CCEAAE|nr:ATP-binding cassette domain-containing protein [Facklamia lactis]MBG9979410.1 ABC-F family ATP-binding cassette domain-containing protein [Facklamia lactis]